MVRSKKNMSSKKTLKNTHQPQLNNPSRNVNNLSGHTENINRQNYNMRNTETQVPEWNSTLTMNEILNSFINNSSSSLFTSGFRMTSQSNFHPTIDNNNFNRNNGIHTLLDQSYLSVNNGYNSRFGTSNNGPRDNMGSQHSNTAPIGKPNGKNYPLTNFDHYFSSKITKPSNSDVNEFKLRNKDFPALPGTRMKMHNVANTPSTMIDTDGADLSSSLDMDQLINKPRGNHLDTTDFHTNGFTVPETGVQTLIENGKVSNIPGNMLRDQFGMVGQLVTLRTIEKYPSLVGLTFGEDLTSLGMNLNSAENIYPTFAGPFENFPLEPHNIEFDVPPEYIINHKIKNQLAPIKLPEYNEDLLFYLFYSHRGDETQMAVASELHTRGWRYHTVDFIWITPVPGSNITEINGNFKHGTFDVFDVQLWRRVTKVLTFDYNLLDTCVENASVVPHATSTE